VIVLDTHIFVWWVNESKQLPKRYLERIESETDGLGVSAISLWEISKLVQLRRLELETPLEEWLDLALAYPNVLVVPLSPSIAIESTRLPQPFHKDPADEIIVATARVLDCSLATLDGKILDYPHVKRVFKES
jgi:PIN domain nuclease of toxin-antitoxin system